MEVVILTKSSKFSGYCVAGLNIKNGKFVRFVSENIATKGALTDKDITYPDGTKVNAFDIVRVNNLKEDKNPIQPENLIIDRNACFSKIGEMNMNQILEIYADDKDEYILGNTNCYIDCKYVNSIGKSLCMVEVSDLIIYKTINFEQRKKTKAFFRYNNRGYTEMSVTDPDYYTIQDNVKYKKAIIVVSIGTPVDGKHFKFVSAIYPI